MESHPFRPAVRAFVLAFCLAALVPSRLAAQSGGPVQVRILARTQERAAGRIFAAGDVEVRFGEVLLLADRVEYDPETKDCRAEGNVVIQSGREVIRGERVLYNLDTGRGSIEAASGLIAPNLLFEAARVERRQSDVYALTRGFLTACAQPNPRWSFGLSRAEVRTDDRLELWDAVVRVKGLPILYLPYLSYPLRERATGFLMPKIGFGGSKGFSFSQSFFWALAPNMDATAGVDLYASRGLGAGLEYRYLFAGGTKGALNLYHFFPKRQADGSRPGGASIVRLDHTQALPFGFSLVANVDHQTSYGFLRDYDNDFRRALSFNRTWQVYLSRSWSRFNVSARASRFETYFSELDDANVTTSLPQINVNVFKTRLFAPVYFSLAASLDRWQYGWKSDYVAGTERRSTRLSASPTLSVPFTSVPWLTATASVTANLNWYAQSLDPGTGAVVDAPLFTRNLLGSVEIVGPVLYRVFAGRDGRARLKNVVEPYVRYSYDSPTRNSDRVVTNFGFFRYHQMSYGLTSRFLFRDGERTFEVFSLGLGQTYYFSPADGPLSRFPVDGVAPRFSEITGTLRFYPRARFSVDAAAAYNPYYDRLSSLRLGATVGSRAGGDYLTVNWLTARNSWITGVDPALIAVYQRDQVGALAGVRLPRLAVDLEVEADYNIETRELLYAGGRLTYHYQCLDFLVDVRSYYYRDPPDVQVRFSLGLGTIGRTLDMLGGFGF